MEVNTDGWFVMYQALYRQWRPLSFADMVGQENVARTLQNALEQGRLAHAYLFCGPRGTGKTSAAKILAKAVNCENGSSREPCNQCDACLGIQAGRVMDVLEIDAASNRGIDDIRELREKVRYSPVEVRHKVYIIDEVHMLSQEAFNALLKTLEEPPSRVMFILATTEPHKLPATIISRCQCLDFHLIGISEIAGRLRQVTASSGRTISEQALFLIAEEAAGGLRDALSLLEQVLAYSSGDVDSSDVLDILGAVGRDVFYSLTDAFLQRDLSAALLLLQDVVSAGKDLHHFTQQAIGYYRDLMVSLACGEQAEALGIAPDWTVRLKKQATALEQAIHSNSVFVLMEDGSKLCGAASLEVDKGYRSAEVTDCAVLPDYRGQGILATLVDRLEEEAKHLELTCLYSLSRALQPGINMVLSAAGYRWYGRLINNCRICSGFEDMNIWQKFISG